MKKSELTSDFIMNYWLKKYHNITVAWLLENEPELIKSPDWYKKYAVTQEQHDEWYNWAIDIMAKTFRLSEKTIKRNFVFDYLNLSPSIKKIMKKDKDVDNCLTLVCSQCGGKNVQIHAWVDANTNKYIGDDVCDVGDIWCEDCEDHTGLVMKSEYDLNYNINKE